MNRTTAEALDRRNRQDPTSWIALVVGVDYIARQLAVNVKGRSGPRRVSVAQSVDLGTATLPKIKVGSQVLIQRLDDKYICIAAL